MKKTKIREMGRDFTVGKPPMFSPLERMYRKVRAATIWQLKRWAKSWPAKARRLGEMHAAWVSIHGDDRSPFIRHLFDLAGAIESIRDEVAHRQTGTPRAFNPGTYELGRITQ